MGFDLSAAAQEFATEQAHLFNHLAFDLVQAATLREEFIAHIGDLVHPLSQGRVAG
jgi:hypothetical protein